MYDLNDDFAGDTRTEQIFHEYNMPWSENGDNYGNIIICSRIRLARNLPDESFPVKLNPQKAREISQKLAKQIMDMSKEDFTYYDIANLSQEKRQILQEKHLISPEMSEGRAGSGVAISQNRRIAIMVNEEDHVRLQCFLPGLQLEKAWDMASSLDDLLWREEVPAFDTQFGYLTACPTNAGTGMRASVMIHAPGLVLSKEIESIFASLSRLGLTVRGIYGEGSTPLGNFFQISNQITAGKSELEIIGVLKESVLKIIESENAARKQLQEKRPIMLYDNIWRAYAILRHARSLSSQEMMERLSLLRLGMDLEIIKAVDGRMINEMIIKGQPAFLQNNCGAALSTTSMRDWERAQLMRNMMKDLPEVYD